MSRFISNKVVFKGEVTVCVSIDSQRCNQDT